ncbi:MAG: serine/threonine protein kinase [Verrucomicrobiota bacterium]|jgi:serine/threonine-protein kinase|nr:serine/threonine protein kinase [Verrucomicrobiota bacterium]
MNQEFAGYSITRSMSGGGMTKLYVAIDAQQNRYVIRVLDAVGAKDRKNRSRFFHGGEVLARLQTPKPHPNIVPFIKTGREGKTPYMVLQYVESRTLRDLILYRDALLTDNVMIFIRQLAVVVHYVHTHGFLHLDIKPENILIRPNGQLVLIDFDLALPRKRFFKKLSTVSGTTAYVPPETLMNKTADDRADIYAFGICCYEMLTFHKPYEGEKIEQVRAAQIDPKVPPTPIRQYNPNIPMALANLIMKCIAKNPEDRYPDMGLVLRDLHTLI